MHRFICLIFLFFTACQDGNYDTEIPVGYNDLAVSPAFIPLPLGEIKPAGWLLDWSRLAARGITGHLDERAATFAKGWSGESFEARGVKEQGTNWPLEQSAYWLDGLVRLAYLLDEPMLIKKAKARLDPIVEGVLKGGPSFIYWRPKSQLAEEFDNWAHSHMGRALVAYYQATHNTRILKALEMVYADYPLPVFNSRFESVNGAVNLGPMLDSYLLSGSERVKQTALAFVRRKDFQEVVNDWNNRRLKVGHTVIFYENIRVPALGYLLSGEQRELQATHVALKWGEMDNLLPQGLVSGEEYMAGIGPARNIETCNVAAAMWTLHWLLRITGESTYADRMEKIFFNAAPVPVSRDFQTMSYYQCANRISPSLPLDRPHHPGTKMDSYAYRDIGHEVLCCVGNSNRMIPNFIMHMWMKTADPGLAAVLYGPSQLSTIINGIRIRIITRTAYPFSDKISISVDPEEELKFPLRFRIPAWCETAQISLNGNPLNIGTQENGFVKLLHKWKKGDHVEIEFPMNISLEQGRSTNFADIPYFKKSKNARRIARSNKEINFPFASIFYGPLLMALPIPDDGPNRIKKAVEINYALDIDPQQPGNGIKCTESDLDVPWVWRLEKPPVAVKVQALQFNWQPTDLQPLPAVPVKKGKRAIIDLVPYNITKFRIAMFPVSQRSWQAGK